VVNFANLDMVGHTGKVAATIKAVEAVDTCLGKIVPKVLSMNGVIIVMADHGNADEVLNADGSMNTEHSGNPVPFILINNQLKKSEPATVSLLDIAKSPVGTLADVMPTILDLLRLPAPETNETWIMRGISLTGRLR
jgi:2,3-bisphosphoglycerate-independent phosphoglycerate mutase